ncbi:DUF3592 domain-containing protein [Massilia sp. CCM 8733]|uniref:DUF3592 domain-containing protein n=1 Tax=Massilia mucilaginosa TaxID=2609282 RepID=A0ABX0NZA4_9BURK|nr:DUF3592 domain-containing protein [Massilia mucilaginosa]NHZ92242.1 DUF3592 domain-containing protein [Massilia mucilaginosa]
MFDPQTGAIVSLGAAIGATGLFIVRLRESRRARAWPTADAVILSSTARQRANGKGYDYAIAYEYSVDGSKYVGTRIGFGGPFAERWQPSPESMLQTYAPGLNMLAHYCPERPEEAVLVPSVHPTVILVLGICVGMALLTGFRYLFFYY